jgi:hypothetical protein
MPKHGYNEVVVKNVKTFADFIANRFREVLAAYNS